MNLPGEIKLKKLFKSEETKFYLAIGLKLVIVYFLSLFIFAWLLKSALSVNISFLEVAGFYSGGAESLEDVVISYVMRETLSIVGYLLAFSILVFFSAQYIGRLLLRPFKIISQYCQCRVEEKKGSYTPEQFSDLKLLTMFSEHFFHYMEMSQKEDRFLDAIIPEYYLKIRKPIFEKIFFFHFLMIFGLIGFFSLFLLHFCTEEIYTQLVQLFLNYDEISYKAMKLPNSAQVQYSTTLKVFLESQGKLLSNMLILGTVISSGLYALLAFHLFNSVSTASFGIFSTFRAYMKGNYNSRVHLIGHNYLRTDTRLINKYLDTFAKELSDKTKKSPSKKSKTSPLEYKKSI